VGGALANNLNFRTTTNTTSSVIRDDDVAWERMRSAAERLGVDLPGVLPRERVIVDDQQSDGDANLSKVQAPLNLSIRHF
jgi:hypothetical protein